ncbi:hypothetical protein AB0M36_20375 [Actinoplanes sp. NPDC051346]|uniref:hypothetical protein n=1 Tax=Actinoplanes sp. NPDC051346 TaxID=3155048 RepID=UPI00343A9217
MTELEQAYGRLLRLYPAEYRRARGAEMLEVLLSSAEPGQRRPPWRERWALAVGALRVRAGAAARRTTWQSWRAALRNATVVLLLCALPRAVEGQFNVDSHLLSGALIALMAAAIILILRDRFLLATTTVVAALVLDLVPNRPFETMFHAPSLLTALVLLVPLIGRGPVVAPRSLQPLLALMLIPTISLVFFNSWFTSSLAYAIASIVVTALVPLIAMMWSIVDERLTLAYGLIQLGPIVLELLHWRRSVDMWSSMAPAMTIFTLAAVVAVPGLCLGLSAQLARRRARI